MENNLLKRFLNEVNNDKHLHRKRSSSTSGAIDSEVRNVPRHSKELFTITMDLLKLRQSMITSMEYLKHNVLGEIQHICTSKQHAFNQMHSIENELLYYCEAVANDFKSLREKHSSDDNGTCLEANVSDLQVPNKGENSLCSDNTIPESQLLHMKAHLNSNPNDNVGSEAPASRQMHGLKRSRISDDNMDVLSGIPEIESGTSVNSLNLHVSSHGSRITSQISEDTQNNNQTSGKPHVQIKRCSILLSQEEKEIVNIVSNYYKRNTETMDDAVQSSTNSSQRSSSSRESTDSGRMPSKKRRKVVSSSSSLSSSSLSSSTLLSSSYITTYTSSYDGTWSPSKPSSTSTSDFSSSCTKSLEDSSYSSIATTDYDLGEISETISSDFESTGSEREAKITTQMKCSCGKSKNININIFYDGLNLKNRK